MKNVFRNEPCWSINLFILFLYAIDVFGFPNKIAIVWIGLFGLWCWKNKKNVGLDTKTFLLAIAMTAHAAIFKYYSPDFSITLTLSLATVPVLFYLLGKQLVGKELDKHIYEYKAKMVVLTIATGMFIHAILNFYAWFQRTGKHWDDFWPDNFCTVTTNHSFLAVAAGGLLGYGIYLAVKKQISSVVILFMALFANWINILYDNRMVLAITIVVLGMNAAICMYLNRNSKRAWRIAAYILLAVILGLGLIWGFNLGNIRNSQYVHHFMTRDGGVIKNIRFQIHAKAISQLFSHWRGGRTMELLGFVSAHNYWLDLANHTGLASFIPMVLFTVSALKDMVLLILSNHVSTKLKYLLPSVFMSIFLYHCMEPGGIPRPDYILYLTIMAGVMYQTQRCAKTSRET